MSNSNNTYIHYLLLCMERTQPCVLVLFGVLFKTMSNLMYYMLH